MKKIVLLLIGICILSFVLWKQKSIILFAQNILYISPCDTPLTYKIGTVDPRFNLSENEFLTDVKDAANIWSIVYGKQLFKYDPEGAIAISMTYDERQSLTNQINSLDTNLNIQKSNITPQLEEYKQKVSAFKKRLEAFNASVSYWNQQGGAPEEEYNKLRSEQEALQNESNALAAMASSLDQSTNDYNKEVQQLNATVQTFNAELQGKPEEGQYISDKNGRRIIIYFNTTQKELIHTLAHEFGHSLSMNHVIGPESIMHPLTNDSTTPSSQDLLELDRVCQKKNIFEILYSNLKLILYKNNNDKP